MLYTSKKKPITCKIQIQLRNYIFLEKIHFLKKIPILFQPVFGHWGQKRPTPVGIGLNLFRLALDLVKTIPRQVSVTPFLVYLHACPSKGNVEERQFFSIS